MKIREGKKKGLGSTLGYEFLLRYFFLNARGQSIRDTGSKKDKMISYVVQVHAN